MSGFPAVGDEYRIALFEGDRGVADEVRAVWTGEVGLEASEVNRRLGELFAVAHHVTDGLVGICTAYLQHVAQLRLDLWHYRAYVSPAHRASYVGANLGNLARFELERRYVDGADRRGPGLVMEVENSELRAGYPQGRWPYAGFEMSFIGMNARGDPVRVLYFPGAQAPVPPA